MSMTPDHARVHSVAIHGEPQNYDVLVVGGGPAGLSAALHLAREGLHVAIVEESDGLGGQYFKRRHGEVLRRYGDYRPAGTGLVNDVRAAGVRCLTERLVWGVGDDGCTLLTTSTSTSDHLALRARAVVIATGAYERAMPFPGWQLPGVVTAGHALHLATCDVVAVGRRVLVAGSGPFLLPVACALLEVGCDVVAVAELNTPYRLRWGSLAAIQQPARLGELARYLAVLARHQVPIRQAWSVIAAEGEANVERVRLRHTLRGGTGAEATYDVDTLAVGYGFRPSTELVRLLGCDCREDPVSGDLIPERDPLGRTSVPGVYAAGEICGIAGVHAASTRGYLAATAVLDDLGINSTPRPQRHRALRRAARFEEFAALNSRLYPVADQLVTGLPDGTLVCRCEGITAGQIRQASALGWNDCNATKGATRAGMGPCQGRECWPSVAALTAADGSSSSAASSFTAQIPIKPISVSAAMGVLADSDGPR